MLPLLAVAFFTVVSMDYPDTPTVGPKTSLLVKWELSEQAQAVRQTHEQNLREARVEKGIEPATAPAWFVVKIRKIKQADPAEESPSLTDLIPCRDNVQNAWSMTGLAPGMWEVIVWITHEGAMPVASASATVNLAAGQKKEIKLTLEPVGTLIISVDLSQVIEKITAVPEMEATLYNADGQVYKSLVRYLPLRTNVCTFDLIGIAQPIALTVTIHCREFTITHVWDVPIEPGGVTILQLQIQPTLVKEQIGVAL